MWSWFWRSSVNNTLTENSKVVPVNTFAAARNAQTENMSELKNCVFVTQDMIVNQLNSLKKIDRTERKKIFKSRNPIVLEISQTVLQL